MKRNLIVIIALVLIMTHVIPPYNIILANDEVNECENMDFTVQMIKENDESIKGNGFASDQLKVDFINKNQSEIANVNSGGQFELKVEAGYLQANDVIRISNDYYSIETQVANEEVGSQTVQSQQHLECPVVEIKEIQKYTDSDDTPKERVASDTDTENGSEEIAVSDTEPEETSEDSVISDTETEDTSEDSAASDTDTENDSEEIAFSDTETEDTSEDSVVSDAEPEETSEFFGTLKRDDDMFSKSKTLETTDIINDEILQKQDEINIEKFNNLIGNNTRLLDVSLLSNATLNGEIIESGEKYRLKLTYRGNTVLSLGVLSNIYTYFQLPLDIPIEDVRIIEANYNAPSLLGIGGLLRKRDSFSQDNIVKDYSNNAIYTKYSNSVSIALASYYIFDLTVELDKLPATLDGQYVFQSAGASGLIDLSILSNDLASLTLDAPVLPQTPSISQPIYSSDEVVSGTGEPNQKIIIRIDNEEYMGETDSEGEFSVTIPPQQEGTVIRVVIESDEGYESEEVSVTVVEPLERPELNPIYSRDSVVTGTGLPNHTVIVTIDNKEYRTETDSNGEFSVTIEPQTPETVITAKLVEESSGIESPEVDTTVLEGTVSFHNVPPVIMFDTTVIDYTQTNMRIPREDDWSIDIRDTRIEGNQYSIYAEAEKPLTNTENQYILPNALVYVNSENEAQSLYGNPVKVHEGVTDGEEITKKKWADDEGVLIEVNPISVQPGTYETTINWTLTDGP